MRDKVSRTVADDGASSNARVALFSASARFPRAICVMARLFHDTASEASSSTHRRKWRSARPYSGGIVSFMPSARYFDRA